MHYRHTESIRSPIEDSAAVQSEDRTFQALTHRHSLQLLPSTPFRQFFYPSFPRPYQAPPLFNIMQFGLSILSTKRCASPRERLKFTGNLSTQSLLIH